MLVAASVFSACDDLLPEPGPVSPRIQFVRSPVLGYPNIPPYNASLWYVNQDPNVPPLQPDHFIVNDSATYDPVLGIAPWHFYSNGLNDVTIYRPSSTAPLVFAIHSKDGLVTQYGGSGIQLIQNLAYPGTLVPFERNHQLNMDANVTYSLAGRLHNIVRNVTKPKGLTSEVLWQAFSGFVFTFVDPGTHQQDGMFLQILHGDPYRTRPYPVLARADQPDLTNGTAKLYQNLFDTDPYFTEDGPLNDYAFNLTDYLCDAVVRLGVYPASARDLGNWTLGAIYISVETQNRGTDNIVRGTAEATLDVASVNIRKNLDLPYNSSSCPTPVHNDAPIGYVGIAGGAMTGWTCDPDAYSRSIDVHFWATGVDIVKLAALVPNAPCGDINGETACFIGGRPASIERPDLLGATPPPCLDSTPHGFSFPIPDVFLNGIAHTIYSRAINYPSGTGINPDLIGSPTPY